MAKKAVKAGGTKKPPAQTRAKKAAKGDVSKAEKGKAAKAAAAPVPQTADELTPLDDFIDAAARALSLPIEPAWRGAIKSNLQVTLQLAALVDEFALNDDTEPAPVFEA